MLSLFRPAVLILKYQYMYPGWEQYTSFGRSHIYPIFHSLFFHKQLFSKGYHLMMAYLVTDI